MAFLTHLLPNPDNKLSTKYVRSTSVNGGVFLKAGEIYGGRGNAWVGQDKKPPGRLTAASDQPATATIPAVGEKGGSATAVTSTSEYTTDTHPAVDRPTHHGSETRRTAQVSGRVSPVLKTQLLQLAKKQGAKTESS